MKEKYITKTEKFGLIYEDKIKKNKFLNIYFSFVNFWYFKNSYIDIIKNIIPIVLVLGQIESDLNVGERSSEKDISKSIFLSIFFKFKS